MRYLGCKPQQSPHTSFHLFIRPSPLSPLSLIDHCSIEFSLGQDLGGGEEQLSQQRKQWNWMLRIRFIVFSFIATGENVAPRLVSSADLPFIPDEM
ncbi:hypothetical protein NPIL_356771 [Nephila pilipes]|uniref:Uncharacterized protein n=1 Tax=Nephila pilipes TaxID=299642 RepID=A0A8X6N2W2_NEPPI|nr:hypothetical protein NPIL_356771 [Nephila pilipes]